MSVLSFAIPVINSLAESEALNVFKLFFHEVNNCKSYDEYVRVSKKYVCSDMIRKMDSTEVKSLPSEFKENLFSMVKYQFFDVKDLVVIEENIKGSKATIKYSRKGHSVLKGTATLVTENNIWKIKKVSEKISLKKKSAGKNVKRKQQFKLFSNATGMKFVLIPAGSFMMGSGVGAVEIANGISHIRSAIRLKLNPKARDFFGAYGFRIVRDF